MAQSFAQIIQEHQRQVHNDRQFVGIKTHTTITNQFTCLCCLVLLLLLFVVVCCCCVVVILIDLIYVFNRTTQA